MPSFALSSPLRSPRSAEPIVACFGIDFIANRGTFSGGISSTLMGSVGNRTYCVVEDEFLLRLDAMLLLEEAGFEVKEFAGADAALAYLDRHAEHVIFLFTDVGLPGHLNGLSLAEVATDRWPWIKIVITSGSVSKIEDRIPRGSAFMRKPWKPAEVLASAIAAARQ
jgi:CheY-like chemotaxis protein